MNMFIVYAHPEPKSFNGAMLGQAQQVLEEQGHLVEVSDLYAMKFDPISDRRNFTTCKDPAYYKQQMEELHASQNQGFAPDIQAEMDKIQWCDFMLWQFPLWWFGLPALLKAWVDRVLAMGFAYGGGKVYQTGVFKGKLAMLALTTGGPEQSYRPGGANGNLNTILFPIQHGMLYFTGMTVLPPFVAWSPARVDDEKRKGYLEQYKQRLLTISATPPLRFE